MLSIRHLALSAASCALLSAAVLAQSTGGPSPLMPVAPKAGGTTLPSTPSPDEQAARAALEKYNAAVSAGDVQQLTEFVAVSTPLQKSALSLMGRLTGTGRSVYNAVLEKFGEKQLTEDGVARESFPAGFPELPLDQLDIRVTGDRASLTIRSSAEAPPLAMRRIDGQWKLDGDALLPAMTDKQLEEQTQVLTAAIGAIEQTAADIKAGHFRAADESVAVMNLRVQKAVRIAQTKLAATAETAPMTPPTTTPAK